MTISDLYLKIFKSKVKNFSPPMSYNSYPVFSLTVTYENNEIFVISGKN